MDDLIARLKNAKSFHVDDVQCFNLNVFYKEKLTPILEEHNEHFKALRFTNNMHKYMPIPYVLPSNSLLYLNLSNCNINVEEAAALALRLEEGLPNLQRLDLSGYDIGPLGAISLGPVKNKNLHHLDLSCNGIGDVGAQALASLEVQELILRSNRIDKEGAVALVTGSVKKKLDLSYNRIGPDGVAEVASKLALLPEGCHVIVYKSGAKTLWKRAVKHAPDRRAFFAFFAGASVSNHGEVANTLYELDGDNAICTRVFELLVRYPFN
jgi:hypothetical protein